MKNSLIFLGLVMMLIFVVGCSESKDSASTLTGGVVANLNPEPVKENQTTKISLVQDQVHYIDVNGKNGIEPKELKVRVSDKLRFVNKDPANKDMEITMQLGGSRKFITTPVVKPNAYTEYFFAEAGNYTYWTIGYGIQAKIEVVN